MQKYPTVYSKDLADDEDMAEAIQASEKEEQNKALKKVDDKTVKEKS